MDAAWIWGFRDLDLAEIEFFGGAICDRSVILGVERGNLIFNFVNIYI